MKNNQFNLEKLSDFIRARKFDKAFKYVEAYKTLYNLVSAYYQNDDEVLKFFYVKYNNELKELFKDSSISIEKTKEKNGKEILFLKQENVLYEVEIDRGEGFDDYVEYKIELSTLDKSANKHRKRNEWIPTKDMMPESNVPVLVTYTEDGIRHSDKIMMYHPCYYSDDWKELYGDQGYDERDILAWKPLDKPYDD